MKKTKLILVSIVILFLFLRLFHFRESVNFGSDQGLELLDILNIVSSGKLTLIGPPSSFGIEGRFFFVGPALYYMLIPPLVIGNWHPFAVSYTLIAFQLVALITLYKVLSQKWKKTWIPIFFTLFYIFDPTLVEYSRFFWNPNFLIPLSTLILALLLKLSYTRKRKNLIVSVIGLLLGLGLQFHYSYLLTILATLLFLLAIRKLQKEKILIFFIGCIIGFSPILFFELRHNFYNLNTIWLYFTSPNGQIAGKTLLNYYLFGLIPFVIYLFALLFEKLRRMNKYAPYLLIGSYIIWTLTKTLPQPENGFTLPKGWNYDGLKKAEEIILSEDKKDYNIVDILTGDTRALALRYLLTVDGQKPLGVTEYPQGKQLFVYSNVPIDKIIKGVLWEIDSIEPVKVAKSWPLQNGISLYLLEKEKPQNLSN